MSDGVRVVFFCEIEGTRYVRLPDLLEALERWETDPAATLRQFREALLDVNAKAVVPT